MRFRLLQVLVSLGTAAALCLLVFCAQCEARSSGRSHRPRRSAGHSYSLPRANSALKPTRLGSALTPSPSTLSYKPRESSPRAPRVTSPRVSAPRSLGRARPSSSPAIPRQKATTAYRTPRATASRQDYYASGLPKHRSESAKRQFLRQRGLERVPQGYEVDHIVPLSEGGADTPANMQLLTESAHHRKTASEAKRYGWHSKR